MSQRERWADVADRYAPDVDDALQLLALAVRSEDWRLLYVVYEIIEDHHARQPADMVIMSMGEGHHIQMIKATEP